MRSKSPKRNAALAAISLISLFSACGLNDTRRGGNGNSNQQALSTSVNPVRADIPAPVGDRVPLPVPTDTIVPPDLTDSTSKTVVGNIPGASSVTADGQAQYEIPIAVPPGRLGMQPALSLLYQSRAPNGLPGVGWKLTGFSQITRCPHSYAVDGVAGPVKGDPNDSYCLDGEYLKEVAESEFRTEHDRFARVTIAYTNTGIIFTVYEKDGRISYYTNVSGDNGSWLLTETDDRYKNTIVYNYTNNPFGPNGPSSANYEYPTSIQYTGSIQNSALVANRTIKFTYEARPYDVESWHNFSPMYMHGRLKTIEVWGPNAQSVSVLLRTYSLTYAANDTRQFANESISHRSLLSSLTESDSSGNQLGKTKFEWELGAVPNLSQGYPQLPDPQYLRLPTSVSDYAGTDKKSGYRLVDLNGDGLDDLLYSIKDANNNIALAVRLRQWGHQDFGPTVPLNIHPSVAYDGTYTFATPVLTSTSAPPSLLVWEQKNGAPKPYASLYPLALVNGQPALDTGVYGFENFDTVFAADFDGDGLGDVISGWSQPGSPSAYYFSRNAQQGPLTFAPGVALAVPSSVSGQAKILRAAAQFRGTDFDGDGRQEMVVCFPDVKSSPTYIVSVDGFNEYNPNSFASPLVSCAAQAADSNNRQIFADFNNDGQDDAFWIWLNFDVGNGTGQITQQTRYSTSPNFLTSAPATDEYGAIDTLQPDWEIRTFDHNEDDHPDLLSSVKGFGVGISDYAGFSITGFAKIVPDDTSLEVGDVNGDGQDDYLVVEGGTLVVYQHDGNKADMLTRVVDGLGAETTFSYKPISDPTIYSPLDFSILTYPLRAVNGGVWVVGKHTLSAGIGVISSYFHKYSGGIEDIQRGFLGFNSHEIDWFKNDGTKVTEVQTFDNVHINNVDPFTAQAVTDTTTTQDQIGNVVHKRVASQSLSLVYNSNFGTYWFYPNSSSVVDYDPDATNALVPTHSSAVAVTSVDAYGHVLTATTTEGTQQRTYTATYNYSLDNWLIDMLAKTVESQTMFVVSPGRRPTRSTQQKTSAYQYDANGGLSWTIIEPNFDSSGNITPLPLPQSDGVQTLFINYLRDPDGQVRQITQDANSVGTAAQRSEIIYRDTPDRVFATRIANTLGRIMHIAIEPSLGVIAAVQDQNGQYSRWQYDTFGRLKRSAPANTEPYSLLYLGWPATGVDPTKPSLELHEVGDAGDEKISQLDLLGQLVHRRSSERNDGVPTQVDLNYDEEHRLVSRTRPYFVLIGTPSGSDTFSYDSVGRPIKSVLADGKTDVSTYVGTATGLQVNHWDAAQTDPTAIQATALFDLGGRVTSNTQHASANGPRPARDLTVSYYYGLFYTLGTIASLNGTMINYQYDRLGRPIALDDPSRGRRWFGYDEFGGLLTEVVGDETRSNVYDGLGRITSQSTRDGSTTWNWDSSANGIGKLGWTASPSGVRTTLQYNGNSQLIDETQTIGSDSYDITVVPDSFSRVTEIFYPLVNGARFGLKYTYGARGALYEIDEVLPKANQSIWQSLETDASGSPTNPSGSFPQYKLGNGVTVRYTESATRPGLLDSIQSVAATPIQSLSYQFDSKDNVSLRSDNLSGLQESFKLDELNRLQYWTVTSPLAGESRIRFDYDDLGNMIGRSYETGVGSNSTYGVTGERGGGPYAVTTANNSTLYSYDGIEGNQTQAGERTAAFAAFGLPLTFSQGPSSYTFRYTSLGSRAEKTMTNSSGADDTVYCGGGAFRSHKSAGTTDYAYTVFGPTGPVAYMRAGADGTIATTSYILQDYRGSTDAIVDSNTNQVTENRNFDPFGSLFSAVNPAGPIPSLSTPVPYGFTGHEHDWDLGLVNMKGRVYDPSLGRFISPDPIGTTMGSSLGMNGYAYVSDNPETFWDPTGFGETGGSNGGGGSEGGGGGSVPTGGPVSSGGDFHTYSGGGVTKHYVATSKTKLTMLADNSRYYKAFVGGMSGSVSAVGRAGTTLLRTGAVSLISTASALGAPDRLLREAGVSQSDIDSVNFGLLMIGVGEIRLAAEVGAESVANTAKTAVSTSAKAAEAAPTLAVDVDRLAQYGANVPTQSGGYFNVVTHADATSAYVQRDGDWIALSSRTLARFIQGIPGYAGGPIRLIACDAGACATGLAQNLANKLGVEVLAPTATAFVDAAGKFWTAGSWLPFMPGRH